MIYILAFFSSLILLMLLSIKWELDLKISIIWSIIMGLFACLSLFLLNGIPYTLNATFKIIIVTSQSIILSLVVILLLFFRDPERTSPKNNRAIISPADGKIKYIKKIHSNEFPFSIKHKKHIPLMEFTKTEIINSGGIQIGIGLTLLDIHVNRSPIDGNISFFKKIPGKFKSLKKISSILENERAIAIIDGKAIKIGIILIASRLVRRISFYLKENEFAHVGERIGMIRFGSQVDILIPEKDSLKINVVTGQKVKAGITELATF